MILIHRHIIRHASYLAKHPWTRRGVALMCLVIFLASIGLGGRSFAANFNQTVTTKADYELGVLSGLDTESTPDRLQLQAAGSWGARSWAEPPDTIESGSAFSSDGTYIYTLRGGSFAYFWRYDPVRNTWRAMANAPFAVGIGSDMRYDSTGAIYATFGLYTKKFAKYTISTNTWTELAETSDVVGNGSGFAFDGTNMYLLRGNNSQDFYRYNIGTNTWDPLTGPPATIYNGADLVYNAGYIYAWRGNNTLSFYRYDIAAGTWSDAAVADVTAGGLMNADGNAMVVGNYIYKARSGGTLTWYRYSISGNTWEALTDVPLTVNYGGVIYVSGTDRIYAFRGTSTRTFWAWNPNTSAWVGSAEPIVSSVAYTVGTGGNLISDGAQYVYLLRGGNTANLLRYDSSANTWSLMASAIVASVTYNFNYDTFGVKAGNYLYFFQGNNTNFLRYDIAGNSWSLLAITLAAIGNGGGLVYPGSGDYIYALRGAGTATFYRYSISGDSWDDASVADLPTSPQTSVANVGGRMVSDGTDIYALPGYGVSRFLKYTVGTNTWSEIASAPFPAYYGASLEYKSGKIYALAGYYKDKFYEYNISGDSWRKLANTQLAAAGGVGAYNGASLAVMGSTIYAVRGNGVADFWTYSIDANSYITSGNYTSPVFDFSFVSAWVSLASTTTAGSDSSLLIETRSSADNSSWTSYQALSGSDIQSTVNRYLQVRLTFTASTDKTVTPTLDDFTVTYTSDETAPTNPSSATGSSQQVGGTALTSGQSYPHVAPYFTWSGASDAGSGLQGYYVYFGTDVNADPATSGSLATTATFTANTAMTAGTYYLRLKAVDNKNNNASSTYAAFTYVYNGVTPPQSLQMTSQANFETGTLTSVSATQSAGNLQLSTATGSWGQESLIAPPASIYVGGMFAYVASSNKLYTFRGNNTTTFYSYDVTANTWTTEGASNFGNVYAGGGVVEGPSGYLYGWIGNGSSSFARYTISSSTWDDSAAADLPLAANYGASAVYDGSRYVYFLRGNSDDAFWSYDTQNNTWANLTNANFGNGTANQTTYLGAALAFDGTDTIYASQGNNYSYFAKYTISTNTWTPLTMAPVGFYVGANLNYDATTNAVYGLAGNNRGTFLKYDTVNDVWSIIQEPPLYTSYGAAQRIIGRNIYTLRGANTTAFWIFDIDNGVWKKPVQNVFGTQYAGTIYYPTSNGASVVKGDGNYYYATRGNIDSQFVRFDRSSSTVVTMAPVPEGLNQGASLVYDSVNGTIYATTGTTNLDFFKYTISSNSWVKINSGSTDLVPASLNAGSDMVYDGSRYIYLSRGANGAQFYRYDTQGSAGSRWSTMTSSTSTPSWGGSLVYNSGYIYMTRGSSTASFYRYDVGANTWSDPLVADAPGTVSTGGSLSLGSDGKIYLARGNIGTPPQNLYVYDITLNTWSTLNNAPAGWGAGGDLSGENGEQLHGFLGQGTNAISDGIYTYTQQTSTTSFAKTGSYTSTAHSLTSVYKWANLTANYTAPANTTVSIKTQSSSDGADWSSLTAVTNAQRTTGTDTYTYQIASPANAYLRVEVTLTSDGLHTPTFNDYTISYYQDTTAPTNPDALTVYDSDEENSTLVTSTWYNYAAPKFSWNAGTDNAGGSGVEGYYLYFGTDSEANPSITSGIINDGSAVQFQTGAEYILDEAMSSGSTYYFLVKTRDNHQNISGSAWEAFTYQFDSTAPTNPGSISVNPAGYSATDSFTFSYSAGSDAQSGVLKYQCRTGGDAVDSWTDSNPLTTTSIALPNDEHAEGQYQSGTNIFYLRTVDNAGNASSSTSANYYYSGSAPTPPQNIEVDNEVSETNSFTITWDPPLTYVGELELLRYRWSVNALPTANNSTETSAESVGPAALATQQGENTFYVVAKDGAGNVDYDLYAQVSFSANTAAPSAPNDFNLNDLSDRDAQKYGAALSWEEPDTYDEGNFSGYKVYRSTDDVTYTVISSTTGTAYVDQGLTGGTRYYYKTTAYTKTNTESVSTSSLSVVPTGKFTSAPTIASETISTNIFARRITFSWITTRAKGDGSGTSFVKCGLTVNDLDITAGDFAQVLAHNVSVEGLTPSTPYKCFLYSTDVDGNTATYGAMDLTTAPPPVVKDVEVTDISLSSARVSFKTNVQAKGELKYGETSEFGSVKEFDSFGQDFSIALTGLKDTTDYFYGFRMVTSDGDVFAQEVINKFETLPMPVVSNVEVEPVLKVDTPTLKVTYTSNIDTSTTVLYSTSGATQLERTASEPLSTKHSIVLSGLLPKRSYKIIAGGGDSFGNDAAPETVYATTKDDTKPPEILSFAIMSQPQTDGKTILVAKVESNEPTVAQLEVAQGSSATSYNISGQADTLNQSHNLSISVPAGGIYSVRVKLADSSGNITYSDPENVSGGIRRLNALQLISRTLVKNFGWLSRLWQ